MREDFSSKTKDILAKRVGYHCSNPKCRTLTCGPRTEKNKFVSIGVASHISAASLLGPRYDKNITPEFRVSSENGIWLCQNCAKMIDNDPLEFPVDLLNLWKSKAERFAANKISLRTTEIIHEPQLLEQLSSFARVDFEYALPHNLNNDEEIKNFIKDATLVIYKMISCAYLQTSKYLKRDKFVFALSLDVDIEDDKIHFFGELITHLTPFGYYFGVFAEMLNQRKIDEIIEYMDSFPEIIISRQLVLGKFIPYKISRINPTKVRIEWNRNRFIFKEGLITTSDLLTFLAQATHGGILVLDDINDEDSVHKILKLHEKIENGFNLTEVSIDTGDPEKWSVNQNEN